MSTSAKTFHMESLAPLNMLPLGYMLLSSNIRNYLQAPKIYCMLFDDFVTLQSFMCIDFKCAIIVGNFNVHIDNSKDGSTFWITLAFPSL